jgi:predicted transcriptional regulator
MQTEAVKEYIKKHPFSQQFEIAKGLDRTYQTIASHIAKLLETKEIKYVLIGNSKYKKYVCTEAFRGDTNFKKHFALQFTYIEVKKGQDKLIERVSAIGLSELQLDEKLQKVSNNIPPSYYCEVVTYPVRLKAAFFSENL